MEHSNDDSAHELKTGLKQRHLTMLSLGGVIGAALLVGSSGIIHAAGPLAFVTYAATGLIVLMVMRMLGEMAAAKPRSGGFADYNRMGLGAWGGFSTGWLYWMFWVIVVGFEAVVGGQMVNSWLPQIPVWVAGLVFLAVLTGVNLLSVGSFGEAEFWFAGIKVVAIVAFITIASLVALGLWPGTTMDFSNLTEHGGVLPNGPGALLAGVGVVIFAMTGAEVATIAAAETTDPAKAIRKAVLSIVVRIIAFFVLSTLLIVIVLPWTSIVPGESPFVAVLDHIGVPGTALMLNFVVLVAALSVLNAGMYTCSRMLFVMARQGDAPKWMSETDSRGVPVKGTLACAAGGCVGILLAALYPDTVFMFLLNASGALVLFVYLLICIAQYRLRRKWEREEPEILTFRVWLFPATTILVGLAIVGVLISMAVRPESRIEILSSLTIWAVICVAYLVKCLRGRRNNSVSDDSEPAVGVAPDAPVVVGDAPTSEKASG